MCLFPYFKNVFLSDICGRPCYFQRFTSRSEIRGKCHFFDLFLACAHVVLICLFFAGNYVNHIINISYWKDWFWLADNIWYIVLCWKRTSYLRLSVHFRLGRNAREPSGKNSCVHVTYLWEKSESCQLCKTKSSVQ